MMTTVDGDELERRIDERIGRAESRLMKWFVGTLVAVALSVSAGLIAYGRTLEQVVNLDRRLAIVETSGSPPLRERLATIEVQLDGVLRLLNERRLK